MAPKFSKPADEMRRQMEPPRGYATTSSRKGGGVLLTDLVRSMGGHVNSDQASGSQEQGNPPNRDDDEGQDLGR